MNVHFIVHESFEAPGAIETWARERGHRASYSRVYLGERLPRSADSIDLLVVMGGPQSPSTTQQECPHFDSAAECALIVRCISAQKAVVGVCLGAQMIGKALGADAERSPEKEIGLFPITMTDAARAHPKFAHFPASLMAGHWHSDMPGLTPDAQVLAYSEGCPRQIIEYGPLVYGFQCHMELTRECIDLLIAAEGKALAALTSHRFVQQPPALRKNDYDSMHPPLFAFLDKLLQDYAT